MQWFILGIHFSRRGHGIGRLIQWHSSCLNSSLNFHGVTVCRNRAQILIMNKIIVHVPVIYILYMLLWVNKYQVLLEFNDRLQYDLKLWYRSIYYTLILSHLRKFWYKRQYDMTNLQILQIIIAKKWHAIFWSLRYIIQIQAYISLAVISSITLFHFTCVTMVTTSSSLTANSYAQKLISIKGSSPVLGVLPCRRLTNPASLAPDCLSERHITANSCESLMLTSL